MTDIFDTSPAADPTTNNLASYAHHTRVAYELRPDVAVSYRSGYPTQVRWRVSHVDVTSKPFAGGVGSPREMVRRYHLGYEALAHRSLLGSVQMEGRCASPVTEGGDQVLVSTQCPRLPRASFGYQRVAGGSDVPVDSRGLAFERFDKAVRSLDASPPHSLDDPNTGLADINGDGLPDVLVTSAGLFGGRHGLYLNGAGTGGTVGFGRLSTMIVEPAADVTDAGILQLKSPTVSALDVDSDGLVDLVHMPQAKRYGVFSPQPTGTGDYKWVGRGISTASQQDVKIDFTREAPNVKVMDVNGDGLVDVVFSSATELQTFFSLGRYLVFCAAWSGTVVRFSDPDTHIADLNGDGLPDIVRVTDGRVLYWPGRGNGFWGTGERDSCLSGSFADGRHIAMANSPRFGIADPGTLLLNDVNGDGLADMVEVRSQGVDIYLNDNGAGWSDRITIDQTPFRPAGNNYVRLTDINGSGTPDILWGRANEYRYIDLTGGKVPYLLTRIANGLGATTELEYASSADVMRAAAAASNPWTSLAPTLMPVLIRTTVRDHLDVIGRAAGVAVTEYTYRNPVFEGRQREFRGFSEATVKAVGDATSPTSYQRTVFQLGECPTGSSGVPSICGPDARWQDNWREALKGLPAVTEIYDDAGTYIATQHATYKLRQLYFGLDGRRVSVVSPVAKDDYLYDTATFDRQSSTTTVDEVIVDIPGLAHTETRSLSLRATAGTAHLQSEAVFDDFGNTVEGIRRGCSAGCPNGVDETITAHSDFFRPPNDPSGWSWREERSYVKGSVTTSRVREVTHTYNAFGDLQASYGVLVGTLPLDRHHAVTGASIAPSPGSQSGGVTAPVQVLIEETTYDIFGQPKTLRKPNGQCAARDFDPDYDQLVVASWAMAGPIDATTGCGGREFKHRVTYDRGFEAVVDSVDQAGQPSHFSYDGFGRLTSSTHADPSHPGLLAALPTTTVTYELPGDSEVTPYTLTRIRTQDGADPNTNSYVEVQQFRDGLGRELVELTPADPTAGDNGDYIASGYVAYDKKGQVTRTYDPAFFSGTPTTALAGPAVSTPYLSVEHDAFGRTFRSYQYDHSISSLVVSHALSSDIYDAADVLPTAHQGTFATAVKDGHGRAVQQIIRIKVGSTLETRAVINEYLPSGELSRVVQRRPGSLDVVRWMKYDSFGRRVLNVEPNTSTGFNAEPSTPPDNIRAWRYAYDDSGRMVGYSDARGCGANHFYDSGGRLVAEDRSPCLASQDPYTPPDLATGNGTEAFYSYDTADPDVGTLLDPGGNHLDVDIALLWGRVASVAGLGAKAVYQYDALGRQTGLAARIQKPGTTSTLVDRYAARWYIKKAAFDAADRVTTAGTGVTTPELLGADGTSELRFSYTKRGLVRQVGSSYGVLYAGGVTLGDGRPQSMTLGDLAGTQRHVAYDVNHRPKDTQIYRGTPELWSNPVGAYVPPAAGDDPTRPLSLEDYSFTYDEVGNLTRAEDHRIPSEWPASAQPVTRNFEYDDLYRLTRTNYEYPAGTTDTWKSPFLAEDQNANLLQAIPQVSQTTRPTEQRYQYDWLGNITQSTDDQNAFWDRSTGNRTHGSAAAGANQVLSASNRVLAPSSVRKGDLSALYDATGNLIGLIVRRDGPCLPSGGSCWQRFDYEWNEVGELTRARRWDLTATPDERTAAQLDQPLPARAPDAQLRFGYDAGGTRTLKSAIDRVGLQKHTVYPFESVEIRSAEFNAEANDYAVNSTTTTVHLSAGPAAARVIYAVENLPNISTAHQHVLFVLSDRLGSTSAMIDKATSELVEETTYQSYGAVESDYRPSRWGSYREPYKFSGKEEDIELGVSYFGARYFSPYLGTWISPDPATIHDLISDTNPYAYVRGTPLMGTDPDGRFAFLPILAIFVTSAIIGLASSAAAQQNATGHIDWGDALLAGGVAGTAGVASGGVGGLVSGALSGAIGGATGAFVGGAVGGLAGGAVGGATGYALSHAGGGGNWSDFGNAMTIGAAGGLSGGMCGGVSSSQFVNALVAGAVGSAVSYGTAVKLTGQKASWSQFSFSVGAGMAGAVASYGGARVFKTVHEETPQLPPSRLQRTSSGDPPHLSEGSGAPGTGSGNRPGLVGEIGGIPSSDSLTYRGDSTPPDIVFKQGLKARGTSTDLLAHAQDSHNPPSAYISTSRSPDVAANFNKDQVYVVRPRGGIDVNATLGPASPYPREQEVAVPWSIKPSDVRAVTFPSQGLSIINWSWK